MAHRGYVSTAERYGANVAAKKGTTGSCEHTAKSARVTDNITLLPLRPCSPELNPLECVWRFLHQSYLADPVYRSADELIDACCRAWNAFVDEPRRIRAIG